MVLDFLSGYSAYAPILLRAVVGFLYAFHGYPEVFRRSSPTGGEKLLASMGVPAPSFFALVIGLLELAGGLALMAGFLTRVFALLLFIQMAVVVFMSIFRLRKPYSIGYELDMLILAALFSIATVGAGIWSFDVMLGY